MRGVLLYKNDDIVKNRVFIQKFRDHCSSFHIPIDVWIYEDMLIMDGVCIHNGRSVPKPDFVVNRTRAYEIAEVLERMEIRLYNRSGISRICNDKDLTYRWAHERGIPFMPYHVLDTKETVPYAYPCILKSCSGHGGNEVFLCRSREELRKYAGILKGRKSIVQQLADRPGEDIRVYVIRKHILVSMLRRAREGIISNYSIHGNACIADLEDQCRGLVGRIMDSMDFDFVGIDILYHKGKPVLNEIEDAVGSRMVYENTGLDPVKLYADLIVRDFQ